jgi:hypothetical protein
MGRGEPGIVPGLTTQLVYFRQEIGIRQPAWKFQESFGALAHTWLQHTTSDQQ